MQNSRRLYFCLPVFIIILTFPIFTHGNASMYGYASKQVLEVKFACGRGTIEGNFTITNGFMPLRIERAKAAYLIPSSFSLQLKRGSSDLGLNMGRKLLNTEKLIFKTDEIDSFSDQGLHVLVNVGPEGVVAIPGKQERKFVIFNIVCDELFLGIPHEAWYVVFLVLLCLGLAVVVLKLLQFLLPKNGSPSFTDTGAAKDS